MSYAQLTRLEDEANYYDSLYDYNQTCELIKGDTKEAKLTGPVTVNTLAYISATNDGTFTNPATLEFVIPSEEPNVVNFSKIGITVQTNVSFTPVPSPLPFDHVINTRGTWFTTNLPAGQIIASSAPAGAKVKVTANISVLLDAVASIGEIIFTLIHARPASTDVIVAISSLSYGVSVPDKQRGTVLSSQVVIDSSADNFYIAIRGENTITVPITRAIFDVCAI